MEKKLFAMIAAVVLLLGLTGCVAEDNPVTSGLTPQEKSLVGIWWDEYDYADVTEKGVPFTKVILVVQVDDDHTGCLYLGAFNDTDYYPVAVYGGKEDAGFKWALLDDGRVQLTDPSPARLPSQSSLYHSATGFFCHRLTQRLAQSRRTMLSIYSVPVPFPSSSP